MSFNVLAPIWLDSLLKQESTQTTISADYRYKRIIHLIKRRQPDLIFLQEATPALLEMIPKNYTVSCSQQTVRGQRPRTAIIIKNDVPITDVKCVPISSKYNYKCTVLAGLYPSRTRAGSYPILLVNVHLEYNDLSVQKKQLRHFMRQIRPYINRSTTIMAGDFNGHFSHFETIFNPTNAKIQLVDVMQGRKTHPNNDEAEMSVSNFLVAGDIRVLSKSVGTARSLRESIKRYGSDHFPIYMTIEL